MNPRRATPARQSSLREHNLALLLGQVADGGPASRARLARATGLTKATVSSLVETLLEAHLLAELGRAPQTTVGRPASVLALAPGGPVGVGVEVNVDYVATCTVDLTGAVIARERVVGDLRGLGVPAALDRVAGVLRRALDPPGPARPVAGVAVAVPGLVETGGGRLLVAPNLGWSDVPVLDELRVRTDLPAALDLRLDNEANLAALGELWFGDGPELGSYVHVSGEIGIGAGVVVGGELFRGRNGFAGELGHVTVRPDGPVCGCGARGCLEAIAGQEAILRAAGLPPSTGTTLATPAGPLARLVERAEAGDERAVDAVRTAGEALGVALAGMVNLFDLDAVLLGGMFALLAPWLREPVQAELAERVLGARWTEPRVEVSRLGWEAAVRGAAGSVVNRIVHNPAEHMRRSA
jgi:predicted NBD/HSP70 family sugar kinase